MRISHWKTNLTRFWQLDRADKWLLLRAIGWLGTARVILIAMPFRRLADKLSESPSDHQDADPAVLSRVGLAVARAANHVPWRSDCFPQTIAAQILLRRLHYSSTIHLGVERVGDSDLAGHAWLTSGDVVVTGGADLSRYTELHTFGA